MALSVLLSNGFLRYVDFVVMEDLECVVFFLIEPLCFSSLQLHCLKEKLGIREKAMRIKNRVKRLGLSFLVIALLFVIYILVKSLLVYY